MRKYGAVIVNFIRSKIGCQMKKGVRIAFRLTSTAKKPTAFRRKHPASPIQAMRIPATAGPATLAALKLAELRAIAFCRSLRPSNSHVKDWRAGISKEFTDPKTAAIAYMFHT